MKKIFLILLFTTSIFAQSSKMLLLMGDEYQALTITASTANYIIDDGGTLQYFEIAGTAGKTLKVDWGDGTVSQITLTGVTTNQRLAKTYASAGIYNVKIYGWNYLTKIRWQSWNAGNFNINDSPESLTYLSLASMGANIKGSINNCPAGLKTLILTNIGTNVTYDSPHLWSSELDFISLRYLGFGQTTIDNILCDIANSNNLAGARTLNLTNNAAPSATGAVCKTTLQGQGWTVTTD